MPKSDEVSWSEFIAHPLATIGAVLSFIGGGLLAVFDPVVATVWSNAGALFAVTSVSSTTIAEQLAWLPKEPLTVVALGAAVLFVANRAWVLVQGYRKESQE